MSKRFPNSSQNKISVGYKAHEKMLCSIRDQDNANQNGNEMISHDWQHQVVVRMYDNSNSHDSASKNVKCYDHFGKEFGCFLQS